MYSNPPSPTVMQRSTKNLHESQLLFYSAMLIEYSSLSMAYHRFGAPGMSVLLRFAALKADKLIILHVHVAIHAATIALWPG